jgi:hypothetical protein
MVAFARLLSPIASIAVAGGPTKQMLFALQAEANEGFSAKNP